MPMHSKASRTDRSVRYLSPNWAGRFAAALRVGQSTRLGGVSPTPYDSLNLSFHTDDDADNVRENRRRLAHDLGFTPERFAGGRQVHGDRLKVVEEAGYWEGYDAFICGRPHIYLTVSVADCTPVLLYDPVAGAVGAAHAGWKGTVAEIAAQTVRAMQREYGSRPADCWAYIGSCIAACDFEVDADVADHFDPVYKNWDAERGKFFVDLKAANRAQLLQVGLPAEQIAISPHSTQSRNDLFFSHRADRGITGRGLGIIGRRQ